MIEKRILNRIIRQVESEETDSPGRVLLEELRERQYQLELQNKQLIEAQFEVERSRVLYASLYDYSPVGLITLDIQGTIKNINLTSAQLLGYERIQLIGKPFSLYLCKNSYSDFLNFIKKCFAPEATAVELVLKNKDNKEINVRIYSNLVNDFISGEKVIHSTLIDITEKKESELFISKSLREKSILLKEIHHRVKNNLQIISSLLNLQSNFMKGSEVYEILLTSRNRVRTMALVHEKLYNSNNLSEININDYLTDLIRNVFDSYKPYPGKISLKVDIKDILINMDTGINLGLIVNELLSNSIKYAFKDKEEGEFEITLTDHIEGKKLLIIKDNGASLPKNINPRKAETLGFQLVCSLVEQLKGEMEIDTTDGTEFKIHF